MEGFIKGVESVNGAINDFVWGPVMLVLLVGTGIWFTCRTHFFQVCKFGHVWRNTIGKLFRKEERKEAAEGALTPWQALSTALAGTIGTGNIVGVATAIVSGGPGAVFWMWVSAFFGMMTKYAEAVLAVKYRQKNAKGEWSGGPMYYITNGLGRNWKWLAVIFAGFAVLASFGIGNISQINSVAGSMKTAFNIPTLVTGIVIALVVTLVILGGVKRIGKFTSAIVPLMSLLYIAGALILLVTNARNIPGAFGLIFSEAFSLQSVGGGVMGYAIARGMRYGFARGVFSNEAGLGSAPIAHAAADTDDPVKQGLYGIVEVFIDTLVVCTLTALVLLSTGVWNSGLEGAELSASAFGTLFGANAGNIFVAVMIFFFAFSTMISWSYYGEKCMEYLFGNKSVYLYKILFVIVIVMGATMDLKLVWDISDTLNGLMAIPNLIALVGLSGVVVKLTRDYVKNRDNFLKM